MDQNTLFYTYPPSPCISQTGNTCTCVLIYFTYVNEGNLDIIDKASLKERESEGIPEGIRA